MQIKDLDLAGGKATVLGKGNKHRQAFFLDTTRDILQKYLNTKEHRPMDPVFHAERGACLTRSGLQQLIHRLGEAAGITGIRCSPHTFRHTAAISATRNGMNSFSLQIMLGHTDLTMTRRYVAIAQADVQEQHRLYSPVRHLMESGVGSAKLE